MGGAPPQGCHGHACKGARAGAHLLADGMAPIIGPHGSQYSLARCASVYECPRATRGEHRHSACRNYVSVAERNEFVSFRREVMRKLPAPRVGSSTASSLTVQGTAGELSHRGGRRRLLAAISAPAVQPHFGRRTPGWEVAMALAIQRCEWCSSCGRLLRRVLPFASCGARTSRPAPCWSAGLMARQ